MKPIITSLLETDAYKFSMGQAIYHQFSDYKTTWSLMVHIFVYYYLHYFIVSLDLLLKQDMFMQPNLLYLESCMVKQESMF